MSLTARLVEHIVTPLWAWHERSPYLRVARKLDAERGLPLEERRARQWEGLRSIVRHAWEQCPFYRERFESIGLEPGDLKTWDDFRRIPVLTKSDIARDKERMVSRSTPPEKLHARKTSGSTGVSLNFFIDDDYSQWIRGVNLYRDQWTGWRPGEQRAMIWGNPEYKKNWRGRLRNFFLDRMFFLDTLRMDTRMMDAFAREVLRKRPTLIFGHAHSLYLFSQFWRERSYPRYEPRGLLSTAMALHSHEREGIASVFGPNVFDRYGCEEVSLIASECEAHQGLHTNTDTLAVEVLKDAGEGLPGRDAGPGEEGKVVVTDLFNRGMPFIRYQIGDLAEPSSETCACGRSYPLLRRVAGRIADYLRTPEGEYVSGISLTENFATLIPGLYQIQIIQDKMDHLHLRVVPRESFGEESVARIQRLVQERFGKKMQYDMDLVEQISPEPSGKYRFAISRLEGAAR